MLKSSNLFFSVSLFIVCIGMVLISATNAQETKRIPIIYSTDLFQPPEDPDDHYDLAIISCLKELELKALIFDLGTPHRKPEEIGTAALNQIEKITGSSLPPWKIGLRNPLRDPDDKALEQPDEFQHGVTLILETLEKSEERVVMFMVGSCRDFAVAFNRNPDLLRKKVKAVYVNAGNGPAGKQTEWNVSLDPNAYAALMSSGLPIYWCPCFTADNLKLPFPDDVSAGKAWCTYFIVPNQAKLFESTRDVVKNYFVYALNKSQEQPLVFLDQTPQPLPESPRNMWCTGPFLHAAGRKIYEKAGHEWIATGSDDAPNRAVEVFRFEPMNIKPIVKTENGKPVVEFLETTDDTTGNIKIFRYVNPNFNGIMNSVLGELLKTL